MYCMQWKSNNCIAEGKKNISGPVRESNPGPLAPKARIMPLDQQASTDWKGENLTINFFTTKIGSVNRSSDFFVG